MVNAPRAWTIEEEQYLIKNKDVPNYILSSKLNRSIDSISHKFKKLNIKKIYNQQKHTDRTLFLSESQLAYCLGILASDGCITIKRNKNGTVVKRFSLTLAEKDVDLLLSVFKILTGEIINYRIVPPSLGKSKKVSYTCTLKDFIKAAEEFGITPNKTKSLHVNLENKSNNFKYYFLRGVIDGDGYVPVNGKISIISASYKFVETLSQHFKGKIKKRKAGDYWDFFLEHFEDTKLPKENWMLTRKSERLINLISKREKNANSE